MKCPKCGSENIGEYMNDGCQVGDTLICCEAGCNHVFSEGQQAEIDRLNGLLDEIEEVAKSIEKTQDTEIDSYREGFLAAASIAKRRREGE